MTLEQPIDRRSGLRRARTTGDVGVEGNARLTGSIAAVLVVLLAVEGLTILRIFPLLRWHIFLGMVLVPPIVLKIGSTGYRFVRYYAGSPHYRSKGAPPILLRLLGPVVVVLTIVMFASGVMLLFDSAQRATLLFVHRASFVLWFAAMTVHVLGHVVETARLAPKDYVARTRRQVGGAGARQWSIAASLAVGAILGVWLMNRTGVFLGR